MKSYRDAWEWRPLVKVADLGPADTYTTSELVTSLRGVSGLIDAFRVVGRLP